MVPTMVKQCDREDHRMLTMDGDAARDEAMKVVIHSFLAEHHQNLDQKNVEEVINQLREERELSSWEICSCSTHVCFLVQGEKCLSRMLEQKILEQVDAELAAADEDRLYLKLPM